MRESPLAKLTLERRVLVTVGAGGVGKTTTAAALSVAAARRGRRVLCLTIDPARRLAESLGIAEMSADAVEIPRARFEAAGVPMEGSLTAMMLDTKRTFDELVVKHSSTPQKAQQLLDNKLYKYVSTSLAGTQEYMAMEKLVAVKDDPRYDLVVLDTPPTANALDFLDAPERLTDALDSATMKWFIEAFESSGKLSLNVIARSAAAVLRGIGKITGGGFLEAMAEFLSELNDLFGGFKERAARVQRTLRSPEVAFVLVTSPSPPSLKEAQYFAERLEQHGMPKGSFIVNRLHVTPPFAETGVTQRQAEDGLAARDVSLEDGGAERCVQAHGDLVRLAALDAQNLRVLDAHGTPIVRVAELDTDVRDIALLAAVGEILMEGGV
ncbi:MAG: ArsA family ATPase [Myxococcales bacterium]|nr:ArsA family ATPase [Myxococcales bacterium]